MQRPKVFFKIAINGQPQGVIVFEVRSTAMPTVISPSSFLLAVFRYRAQNGR